VLLAVVREGRIRLSEIAATEGINPTMLSRLIADFVRDGLVQRECDPNDRRAAYVSATRASRRLAERIRRERTDSLTRALDTLSAADRAAIERALPALEALAEGLTGSST
jgi:DNA-binding MarR family transcriptional regulator